MLSKFTLISSCLVAISTPLMGNSPTCQQQEIKELTQRWMTTLEGGSPASVSALYAQDALLLPTLSNTIRTDRKGIEEYFTYLLAMHPKASLMQQEIRCDGDMAIDGGLLAFTLDGDYGPQKVITRYTFVYHKGKDGWEILTHHNSLLPEAVPVAKEKK